MAKSKVNVEHEDAIRDIYDTVQEAGSTRAEMNDALEAIADLCTDAIPELDRTEESASDEDE